MSEQSRSRCDKGLVNDPRSYRSWYGGVARLEGLWDRHLRGGGWPVLSGLGIYNETTLFLL